MELNVSSLTRFVAAIGATALIEQPSSAQLALTPYSTNLGFHLSTWGTGFATLNNIGPLGIIPLSNGKVLVAQYTGQLRLFPYDTPLVPGGSMPTQPASSATVLASLGNANAVGLAVIIGSPDRFYLTQQSLGRVVEIDPLTGAVTTLPGSPSIPTATGIIAFPPAASFSGAPAHLGHLFVSSPSPARITELDPATGTTSLVVPTYLDGITFTPSGQYLMGANGSGFHVVDLLPTPHVAYSVAISGGDGIALGRGVALSGKAYVNANDGKVWEVVYDTNPASGSELEPPSTPIVNLIASGGTRGDFIAVDSRVLCGGVTMRYPSLLITQSTTIVRLDLLDSGWYGPPDSVEIVVLADQSFCAGDGTLPTTCPCSNVGLAGHGCDNSAGTGGALLDITGSTVPDTIVLASTGELPSSTSFFVQGSAASANGVVYGAGVLCIGGSLKRIAVKNAVNGQALYPDLFEPSITARSAELGDPIQHGTSRYYQVCYSELVTGFCGSAAIRFNSSNAMRVDW
jgi:hypothetical protein